MKFNICRTSGLADEEFLKSVGAVPSIDNAYPDHPHFGTVELETMEQLMQLVTSEQYRYLPFIVYVVDHNKIQNTIEIQNDYRE